MGGFINGRRGATLVVVLLIIQLALLWLSLDAGPFSKISLFCTGPASSRLSPLFALLHLLFLGLLPVGLLSLRLTRLRLLYTALLAASLPMLPIQATLVSNGVLSCDAP